MRTFPSPTIFSARDAVDSGRGIRALLRFRHAHAKIRWLFHALLPAAHVAPAVSLHTPFVDSSVSKKIHQRATLLASAVFFTALRSPVALCIAGGRGFCSLAPLALSRRAPFSASWANTRQKTTQFFLRIKSWAYTGGKHKPR
jgi:hypothetical protein